MPVEPVNQTENLVQEDDSNNFENDGNEGFNLVNESHEKTSGEYDETVHQETMPVEPTNQMENLVQSDDDSNNFNEQILIVPDIHPCISSPPKTKKWKRSINKVEGNKVKRVRHEKKNSNKRKQHDGEGNVNKKQKN